jgi:hypothetical protein
MVVEANRPTKKTYAPPQLTVYGDVETITLATQCGQVTDAAFPAGTPFGQITCS